MNVAVKLIGSIVLLAIMVGCETTNSIPYKASTNNVIELQSKLKDRGIEVGLGDIVLAAGVEENLLCRLNGPVKVAPGKTMAEYIKDAMQEELFMAQAYSNSASTILSGTIDEIKFSSVSPAYWEITMTTKSNHYDGYQVKTRYEFNTSYTAYSACRNVADAFGPAVQTLIKEIISHEEFGLLYKTQLSQQSDVDSTKIK